MASFTISPSTLSGELTLPSSKSHTLRSLIFALLAKGTSKIIKPLNSFDTDQMIKVIEELGAKVTRSENEIVVVGVNKQLIAPTTLIDAGNSGIIYRFIAALCAHLDSYTMISGDESIKTNRVITPLLSALKQLGCFAVSNLNNGYAPITVKGPIIGHYAKVCGEDSQVISALLISLSLMNRKTTLEVTNPGEKPWIDMTLSWLKKFGIEVENENYEKYVIKGHAEISGFEVTIPGDLSSLAYPVVAALITQSEITINNVDLEDVQGDSKFIEVLEEMGAKFAWNSKEKKLKVLKQKETLNGIEVNLNNHVDMITILPVLASFASSPTKIYGAEMARNKECDRIKAISNELKKMGVKLTESDDGLTIYPSKLRGSQINSYFDHRITLACSVAALAANKNSEISGVECIDKTYSSFQADFLKLGARIL